MSSVADRRLCVLEFRYPDACSPLVRECPEGRVVGDVWCEGDVFCVVGFWWSGSLGETVRVFYGSEYRMAAAHFGAMAAIERRRERFLWYAGELSRVSDVGRMRYWRRRRYEVDCLPEEVGFVRVGVGGERVVFGDWRGWDWIHGLVHQSCDLRVEVRPAPVSMGRGWVVCGEGVCGGYVKAGRPRFFEDIVEAEEYGRFLEKLDIHGALSEELKGYVGAREWLSSFVDV